MTKTYVMGQPPQWVPAAIPGREHRYSNTNYFVLARIVESVTSLGFSESVEANLIEPFGLRTTALDPVERCKLQIANGYHNLGS